MSRSKKLTPEETEQRNKEQCEKSLALGKALFSLDIKEIEKCFANNGEIEFTAKALGFACRFCGLEYVKTLVECGASFKFKYNYEICLNLSSFKYAIPTKTEYQLMLLDYSALKYPLILGGVYEENTFTPENGKAMELLPFEERLEIIKYLDKNAEKTYFDKDMLYYCSIIADDNKMTAALKNIGAVINETVKTALTGKDIRKEPMQNVWLRFCNASGQTTIKQFISIVEHLSEMIEGAFHYTDSFSERAHDKLTNAESLKVILERFNRSKMNQTLIIKAIIDADNTQALEVIEKNGWLNQPKKRDNMIDYAVQNKKAECAAYLLDFKNRTADLAAEREKAEKKQMRQLNAAPDSVEMLKKIWSYKKRDDGTLIITSYKGTSKTPVVPKYIGKSTVTAIGKNAFCWRAPRITTQNVETRRHITSVTLPDTITSIGEHAFFVCQCLKEITLPKGVTEILRGAFAKCEQLKSIVIPESVTTLKENVFYQCSSLESAEVKGAIKEIPAYCFRECSSLKKFIIPEGIQKVGYFAFQSSGLEEITIPKSVERIESQSFANCKNLRYVHIKADLDSFADIEFNKCPQLEKINITGRVKTLDIYTHSLAIAKSVIISEGLEHINIINGTEINIASDLITLPRSLNSIEIVLSKSSNNVSDKENKPTAEFHVPRGSFAEQFCREKNYRCIITD